MTHTYAVFATDDTVELNIIRESTLSVVTGLRLTPDDADRLAEGLRVKAAAVRSKATTFTCPDCGAVSHNPNDAREGYCGRCHAWTRPDPTTPGNP